MLIKKSFWRVTAWIVIIKTWWKAMKKSKSLNFVSKECFWRVRAYKVIIKTWWKAVVGFSLIMEVRMKVWVFSGNSLNKSIPRKKKLSCSKQVLLKRISHQEMFSEKGVLKTNWQTSKPNKPTLSDCIKLRQSLWASSNGIHL